MIDRIVKNEDRLNNLNDITHELKQSLEKFIASKKDLKLLNNYYGSKNWFKDKEAYENGKIPKINAGVLSEDAVWNLLEDINYLMKEFKKVSKEKF